MKANRAYRLSHSRGGPRLFAGPEDVDTVEIVEIASNEIVLFWDVPTRDARHFVGALRSELAGAEADDFVARWSAVSGPEDL
jgi:hypothetical protein